MSVAIDRSLKISYLLFLVIFASFSILHLTTGMVATLFSYLALKKLSLGSKPKVPAIILFCILLSCIFYGFGYFFKHTVVAVPEIVDKSLPQIVDFATKKGIDLPFSDVESLKATVLEGVYSAFGYVSNFARIATFESVFFIIGIVVAVGIFLNPHIDDNRTPHPLNLFSLHCGHLAGLFASFYKSFETVMGAQVIISAINTFLTSIYVLAVGMPYAPFIIVVTFLCGLLPVIGNLISNTVIVCIAFRVSPSFAGWALLFLITIHKLEYFLNSRIIGGRIRHPMWLTLIALVFGERLFGMSGVILAPVLLHFIKVEASRFLVDRAEVKLSPADDV